MSDEKKAIIKAAWITGVLGCLGVVIAALIGLSLPFIEKFAVETNPFSIVVVVTATASSDTVDPTRFNVGDTIYVTANYIGLFTQANIQEANLAYVQVEHLPPIFILDEESKAIFPADYLPKGTELSILAGPVQGKDYVLYQVATSQLSGWVVENWLSSERPEIPEITVEFQVGDFAIAEVPAGSELVVFISPISLDEESDILVAAGSRPWGVLANGSQVNIGDGPIIEKGYVLYKIYNSEIAGWVVADWLKPIGSSSPTQTP